VSGAPQSEDPRTPLPPVDRQQVERFWTRVVASGVVPPGTPVPRAVEPFGDSAELADELLHLVLQGPKRATAAALAEYQRTDEPVPSPGDLLIATDGRGRARALLRFTEVRIGPLRSVDDAFAFDEGVGDRTRAMWLQLLEGYFRSYLPTVGLEFAPDMATVFHRFDVLFAEEGGAG
jgi:uncharacterized protein YhfF